MTTVTLKAPRVRPTTTPISKRELSEGARVLARADGFDAAALKPLRALAGRYGAVHDVDVKAELDRMGRKAGGSLEALYASLQKLKRAGKLSSPGKSETVSDEALQRLAAGDLTERVQKHVQKTARLELLKLFADPVKDKALRTLVAADLKKSFGVDDATIKKSEVPPNITLRERDSRRANALVALLFDAKLPVDVKRVAVEKLALCASTDATATLASLAKVEPSLAGAVKSTTDAIAKASKMTIVLASMEVAPYAFAGGLGNVMAELPKALARMGHRVIVIAPRHTIIDRNKLTDTGARLTIKHPDGTEPANILKDVVDGVEHYFIENGKYFSDGRYGLYGDAHGSYGDVAERYDFFSMAIPEAIKAVLGKEKADVVQLNDAHTAPAAAYLKNDPAFRETKTVMAIHNLGGAYQGRVDAAKLSHMGFKDLGLYYPTGPAEFYGSINFLKIGLVGADAAIAVSREYASEILEKENGEGLEGVLRLLHAEDRLWGNLNGIDTKSWDPATDKALPAPYSFADQRGKAVCKASLQKQYGLAEDANVAVVGVVSRITDQKGIDDIVATIDRRMSAGERVQFVVCGQGDPALCAQLQDLAKRYPKNVAFDGAFTKDKERKIIAGADLFLMPSRFEPCGLPQMYAMRYLTAPVVRSVGGLEESVTQWDPATHEGNGFKGRDVEKALDEALAWFNNGDRAALVRNCALTDFSWESSSAVEQVAFFRKVLNS